MMATGRGSTLGRALVDLLQHYVRPYDMLRDRRRWFWQPAAECLTINALAAMWDAGCCPYCGHRVDRPGCDRYDVNGARMHRGDW